MKIIFSVALMLVVFAGQAQHSLEKLWETDSTLAVPESVLFDNNSLYVALIDGQPWEVDGKGGVGKVDKTGKIVNATWVTGLNAPKGMGIWDKKLYVADVSEVVVVDLASGKIDSKIAVAGATGLNDITIDKKGTVYVSDSKIGNVHHIQNGKAELYLSDLKGVNGLKAIDKDLYVLAGTTGVVKVDADKKQTVITAMEIGGDGIEPVGKDEFIVSCWPGVVYHLGKDGKLQTLLDTRNEKKNTADIGYNSSEKIVYIPTFFKKSIVAYKLK